MRREGRYTKKKAGRSAWLSTNKYILWFRGLKLWQKLAIIFTPIILVLIAIPLVTYAVLARDIADPERLMNRNNTGLVITDKDGEVIHEFGRAKHRELVSLEEMSPQLIDALLASEDKNFYEHAGFSILSIFRAAITGVGGGSTITQQLAKNNLLTSEQTYLRKYQELFMSIAIERNYSKDEILTMYLNSVFYGENAFGIEDASRTYFNKTPAELTLAESAMLVGLLPAPSIYSPISGDPEKAKQRQTTVLKRMVEEDKITQEDRDAALAETLVYAEASNGQDRVAPHFVGQVMESLNEKYGEERVMRSGYQVKTTLDIQAQQTLQAQVDQNMNAIRAQNGSNAGAIAIDPRTGDVIAYVGSYDYSDEEFGAVDIVQAKRQPGSSFKPIYYAGALASGTITPSTIIEDKPTTFPGGYEPQNAMRNFNGNVTVRQALSWSLNIPAVKVMEMYGYEKSIQTAKDLGITTLDEEADYGLSLALGSGEAKLSEMTNAYATFANEGKKNDLNYITEIKDKFNKVILSGQTLKNEQAISAEGAYLVTHILSDNAARAGMFGSSLTVQGKRTAVKTGTTDNSRDAWTIGYTPDIAIGVWVGNNDNEIMNQGGGGLAGPIWRGAISSLAEAQSVRDPFKRPGGVIEKDTCYGTGKLATSSGTNTYREVYLASALPEFGCSAQREEREEENRNEEEEDDEEEEEETTPRQPNPDQQNGNNPQSPPTNPGAGNDEDTGEEEGDGGNTDDESSGGGETGGGPNNTTSGPGGGGSETNQGSPGSGGLTP